MSRLKHPALPFMLAVALLTATWGLSQVYAGLSSPESLTLVLSPAPDEVTERNIQVLQSRFGQAGAWISSVDRAGGVVRISFRFPEGQPSKSSIGFLAKSPGSLRVFDGANTDDIWLTESGIGKVDLAVDDPTEDSGLRQTGLLSVETTPEAAARLQRLSTASKGHHVVIAVDGRTVSEATVAGPFGPRVQLPMASVDEAADMAIVLRSGALPAQAVAEVQYTNETDRGFPSF
ncbi:MAG: hypothetical protein JWQ90_419 [Hydrocarboniphaga sp.]|uniref:SecDF P1 head subdomain-containing protein n=1 Tax=Hydrocarboniphaga sp. TaxID=2033016 RepID=UPI00262F02CD|nr:hypothetical protein [Hydrocarboniphaga sp.]MDB5967969.1 hypothetical protein [Hydrocarboniphaga sp.]